MKSNNTNTELLKRLSSLGIHVRGKDVFLRIPLVSTDNEVVEVELKALYAVNAVRVMADKLKELQDDRRNFEWLSGKKEDVAAALTNLPDGCSVAAMIRREDSHG